MAKRRRVAVMIDLEWPYKYHQEVFVGVQRYAEESESWECEIDPHPDTTLSRWPKKRPYYDGIVGRLTKGVVELARRLKAPTVNVWLNSPITPTSPSVVQDQHQAGVMAAEHLLSRGLRTFGYLGYRNDRNARQQWDGFRSTLRQAGLDSSRLLVQRDCSATGARWLAFKAEIDAWIASWSSPIGIFVIHDLTCRYLAEAIHRRDWRVPQDAALIGGFNEPMISLSGEPTMTGIEWGFERLGYRAATLLDRLMDGDVPPTAPQLMQPLNIAVRRSTDVFAVDDALVSKSLEYISEHSHEPIQVEDVATAVASARRSLERRFRAALGASIADEITRMRIERVKRLLITTDLPIKSLASQSGFGGAIQLCKVFRRLEGKTPGEFRKHRR
jgi:LacI family transcriptional regulator